MKTIKFIFSRIISDIKNCKLALLILVLYFLSTQSVFHCSCPSVLFFGLPCPACGLTRAGIELLKGHFADAASYNITIYLWMPFLLYCVVFRYVIGKKIPHALLLTALICFATMLSFFHTVLIGETVPVNYPGILRQLLLLAE